MCFCVCVYILCAYTKGTVHILRCTCTHMQLHTCLNVLMYAYLRVLVYLHIVFVHGKAHILIRYTCTYIIVTHVCTCTQN